MNAGLGSDQHKQRAFAVKWMKNYTHLLVIMVKMLKIHYFLTVNMSIICILVMPTI
jgi:hypothetical protein